MGNCSTKILRVEFDVTDDQITNVTVEQDFWGDCPMQLQRIYKKSFPARISMADLCLKEIPNYLMW